MRRRGTLTLRREDGRIICETVEVADTAGRRLKGLLGRSSLRAGEGIVLRPGFSIHTAFMRFPIDVVFLDHDLVVLRVKAAMGPFHTASCRGAREVVELAAGECARRGLGVGDRVAWASYADSPHANGAPAGAPHHSPEPHGRVLVVSRDARFVKLARFLLGQEGLGPEAVAPERLHTALESDEQVAVVVLDAQDSVAATLSEANAARALRPDVPIVLVGETRAAERAPIGVRIYDKWNETGEMIAAVGRHLAQAAGDPDLPPLDRSA